MRGRCRRCTLRLQSGRQGAETGKRQIARCRCSHRHGVGHGIDEFRGQGFGGGVVVVLAVSQQCKRCWLVAGLDGIAGGHGGRPGVELVG